MRGAIPVAVSVLWLTVPCGRAVAQGNESPWRNAAIVYRKALDAMPSFTNEERALLTAGNSSSVDPSVRAGLLRRLQPTMELLRRAAEIPDCWWGLPFEEKGPGTELPHLTGMSELRPFAQWYAEARLAEDPRAFTEEEMAIIAAGRQVGRDGPLVSLLAGYGLERAAIKKLARHLPELPTGALAELESRWESLPLGGDLRTAIAMEKACVTDWLIKQIRRAMGHAAGSVAATDMQALAWKTAEGSPFADLRVSALVLVEGMPIRVGFERKGGDTFFLMLGERKHGIELLSADYEREEAFVLVDGEAAHLCLRSRRVVPVELQTTRELLVEVFGEQDGMEMAAELLERIGDEPSVFLDLLKQADSDLERLCNAVDLAPAEFDAWYREFEEDMNPLSQWLIPTIGPTRVKEAELETHRAMLAAGIRILREGPAAAAASADPYGEGPFRYEPTADGFRLVSELTLEGRPVTLDFGTGPG